METMTKTMETAMGAVESARPWDGATTARAVTLGRIQGRAVSFAGRNGRFGADSFVTAVATAPITGVVCSRLEVPPV